MKVASNTHDLFIRRKLNAIQSSVGTATNRLSSGLRINTAKDDAAGLNISQQLQSRVRGLNVAQRNINDAISMLQTSDGGLSEITDMLQRIRELAVRTSSTGSMSSQDRQHSHEEAKQLLSEIDRISKHTFFNDIPLYNNIYKSSIVVASDNLESNITNSLKSTWLEQSENAISTWYGLNADNADLTINYVDGVTGGKAAYVTATNFDPATGLSGGLSLTIELADFSSPSLPDGGSGWMYYDRIIAHEMVHAVMHRTVNTQALPTWFMEGAAELIHGADKRVASDGGLAGVINTDIKVWGDEAAGTESKEYSKAYLAARYINDELRASGKTMVDLFNYLETNKVGANSSTYLYDGLNSLIGAGTFNNENHFMAKFKNYANANYSGLNLTDSADTGAIGGADANGLNTRGDVSDEGVIANTINYLDDPTNFSIQFPGLTSSSSGGGGYAGQVAFDIQLGSQAGETAKVNLVIVNTRWLKVNDIDLVNNAQGAIGKVDTAINYLSEQRARLGAEMNRMEAVKSINDTKLESLSAANSRITDTDYAVEMSMFARDQILTQSASAMMAQTKITSEMALELLTRQTSNLTGSLNQRAAAQGFQPVG